MTTLNTVNSLMSPTVILRYIIKTTSNVQLIKSQSKKGYPSQSHNLLHHTAMAGSRDLRILFFFANKARHGCTEQFCLNVTMLFNDMQTQKIKSKLTLSFTLINQLIRPLRKQNFTSMSSNVHGL